MNVRVSSDSEGKRLDNFMSEYLGKSRSNIEKHIKLGDVTVNGIKVKSGYVLKENDIIDYVDWNETTKVEKENLPIDIIYEDEDVLVVNKPSGMLSQKAAPDDISINEFISAYISDNNSASGFKPGICNRLDRNTSGLVVAGKTMYGLQTMSMAFHDRTLLKYYICIVKGCFNTSVKLSGYLKKDTNKNISTIISDEEYEREDNRKKSEFSPINTEFIPVISGQNMSLVKVHLITGKPHQIRAHLMFTGFPVAGDHKYGDGQFNKYLSVNYGIKSQMLHAFQLIIPPEAYPKT